MNKKQIKRILIDVIDGSLSIDDALNKLKHLPYKNLGYAMVDHHRSLRKAYPETIFAKGKTISQIVGIVDELLNNKTINIIITKANVDVYKSIKSIHNSAIYYEIASIIVLNSVHLSTTDTNILVISAGTSDINICEEAAITAKTMGSRVERLYDVGVAGIQRLFLNQKKIDSSSVIIVVAGMDGVLPSVVAGLTDKPVIAVPTSGGGYGANFYGLAPLLTMLNSCSSGLTVVNIDNGYGAGYAAAVINEIANRAQ